MFLPRSGIRLYGHPEYVLGPFQRVMLIELHMRRAGDLGLGGSGDDFGMIALGNVRQRLHDALHVHDHGIHRAGDERQFLLQEVTGEGDAVPHQHFVGGTALTRQIDPLCAGVCCQLHDLRVMSRRHDHFGQEGFVTVDDDIHLIFLEYAEVDLPQSRRRRTEEDILKLGGDHAAAPAVRQGNPDALLQKVMILHVDTGMGAVHQFYNLPVDAAGHDAVLAPDLLTLTGSTLDKGNFTTVPAEFVQGFPAEIGGDFLTGTITDFDAEIHGQGKQFLLVPDLITAHIAFTDGH